jgi:Fe-S cluster assembly protein SufD
MSVAAIEPGPLLRAQLEALDEQDAALPGAGVPWLREARLAARAGLRADGLPRAGDEAWKYTSLKPWSEQALRAPERDEAALAAMSAMLHSIPAPRLVFVNGAYDAALSDSAGIDAQQISVQSLSQALNRGADGLCHTLSARFDGRAHAFARLAAAWSSDGVALRVAPGAQIETPVQLVFVGAAAAAGAWHLRHVLRLGAGSALRVVEHHLGANERATLANQLWQVQIDEGAQLDHTRVQMQANACAHVARIEAELGSRAVWRLTALEQGAQLSRLELDGTLAGDGAGIELTGASVLRGRRHGDVQLRVRHRARDTQSRVLWRSIADERARAVFDGGIVVEVGADGSDAQLRNNNLLLSPHAEIDTKPLLEIFADEVKAAHGATVGQLDERALFYLRTRGVPETQARAMLTQAFVASVFDGIAHAPMRERVLAALAAGAPVAEQPR